MFSSPGGGGLRKDCIFGTKGYSAPERTWGGLQQLLANSWANAVISRSGCFTFAKRGLFSLGAVDHGSLSEGVRHLNEAVDERLVTVFWNFFKSLPSPLITYTKNRCFDIILLLIFLLFEYYYCILFIPFKLSNYIISLFAIYCGVSQSFSFSDPNRSSDDPQRVQFFWVMLVYCGFLCSLYCWYLLWTSWWKPFKCASSSTHQTLSLVPHVTPWCCVFIRYDKEPLTH